VRKIIRGIIWALLAFILLLGAGAGVAWWRLHPSPPGVQVWTNGQILTMDAEGRQASALAIEGDRIVAVGSEADVQPWLGKADVVLDLEGRTVVPGFIEAHGHFPGAGLTAVAADLNSPPIGNVRTIGDALAALRKVDLGTTTRCSRNSVTSPARISTASRRRAQFSRCTFQGTWWW
jgi:hypothetical protein